jgi:hypothetical protein
MIWRLVNKAAQRIWKEAAKACYWDNNLEFSGQAKGNGISHYGQAMEGDF